MKRFIICCLIMATISVIVSFKFTYDIANNIEVNINENALKNKE